MRFTSVFIKNFLSIGEAEVQFEDGHLILIEGRNLDEGGSNGAGKSSLWDAISWALFGQTVRGLKGDEVISRVAGKDCTVRLSFDFKGKTYTVFRHRGDKHFGDKLIIHHGADKTELGTLAQTQDWLLQVLGIDFELFRCTVLFAQEETFNFVNATNKQQKEILSKIMKVDYDEYLSKAKEKYSQAEEEISSIDNKMAVLRSHLVADEESLFREEIEAWNQEQEQLVEEAETKLRDLRAKVAKVDEGRVEQIRSAISKITEKVNKLDTILIRTNAAVMSKINDIKKLKAVKENSECPTCGTEIDAEKFEGKIVEEGGELNVLKAHLKEKQDQKHAIEVKLLSLEDMLSKARAEESMAKSRQSEIKSAERSFAELSLRLNPFIKKREEAIAKQADIKAKIKEFETKASKIKRDLPYYEFWTRAFGDSGIKSFVFDLICATLTNRANNYLNKMTGGAVTISFDTQTKLKSGELRDKFDCVVAKGGKRVPYISYSGGEKRRISLAVDMALSDLMSDYYGSKFNFVVFDEQTNYLDRSGRESFMNLLKDVAREKTVFVVDHDAEFKAMFDESWTIEKQGGVSRVV